MKNIILSNVYIILYTFLFTTSAIAGGEVSGGGTLLVCKSNGSYQASLYDLKNNKNAVLKLPNFKFTEDKNAELELEPLNIESLEGFKFLQQLNSPVINHILEYALEYGRWLSNNADLAKLHDISNPESVAKNCKLYQLAIHYGGIVIFQRDLLKLLDQSPIQQAAAILHESLRVYLTGSSHMFALTTNHLSASKFLTSTEIEKIVFSLISSQPLPNQFDVGFKVAMGFPFYSEDEAIRLSNSIEADWPKGTRYEVVESSIKSWFEEVKLQAHTTQELIKLTKSYSMATYALGEFRVNYPTDKVSSSLAYYRKIKKKEIFDFIESLPLEAGCVNGMNQKSQQHEKLICILDNEHNRNLKYGILVLFNWGTPLSTTARYLVTNSLYEYMIEHNNSLRKEEYRVFIKNMKLAMKFMPTILMKVGI